MTALLEALMILPALPIGRALWCEWREHHVLSRRPAAGKHRRERVRERTSA